MMHFIIKLSICIFFLRKKVGAQVNIPAVTPPRNGDTVILTCIISPFIWPAAWKNNDNRATITTCFRNGICSPSSDGVQYNFSATSSSIIVTIASFNSTTDTFTWKCEHNGIVAVYRIMASTMSTTTLTKNITPTPNTTVTTAPGSIVTPTPNTGRTPTSNIAVTTTSNTAVTTIPNTAVTTIPNTAVTTTPNTAVTTTPNTAVTTTPNAIASKTVMPVPLTTFPQSQLALIIGVAVSGSVLILVIVIICCCCCQCCCLYHCRNKYGTDSEAIKDNQDAKEEEKKVKRWIPKSSMQAV